MTDAQRDVINQLRDAGYAVILWTPEEIGEADISHLEDIVIERGNNFLEYTRG